jgi:hypothetical protein
MPGWLAMLIRRQVVCSHHIHVDARAVGITKNLDENQAVTGK